MFNFIGQFKHVTHLNLIPIYPRLVETGARELWHSDFLPSRSFASSRAIRPLRIQVSDAEGIEDFFRSGPVPVHALRPVHLPEKPARHRGVPAFANPASLRDGHSRVGLQEQSGLRQRAAGLARLLRACGGAHPKGEEAVCEREIHRGNRPGCLRFGRVGGGPLHVLVPVGEVPQSEVGGEDPRHDRLERPDSRLRGGGFLSDGPRIPRLRASGAHRRGQGVLRDQGEEELKILRPGLEAGGQVDRPAGRPDHPAQRRQEQGVLPLQSSAHKLRGYGNGQDAGLHFELDAVVVAKVYKARWQIELFFKWIKQNLRIKSFYGTSENAVNTQIWIAVCTYLLVAILNKTGRMNQNLYRILQVLSVNIFSKAPVHQLFAKDNTSNSNFDNRNQLMFNDF